MTSPDITRRLRPNLISQDVDSLNGLNAIPNYKASRSQASLETLQHTYQAMLTQQQLETERLAL